MEKSKDDLEKEKTLNQAEDNTENIDTDTTANETADNADDLEKGQEEPKNELEEKLEKAEQTAKDYLDRLQRTLAEFDNFRKRTNAEKASMYENGSIDIIQRILPIYDNFERAISSTQEEEKNSTVFKGLEMIFKQLNDLFVSLEIKEVAGLGETFDPNIHNAVMHTEDSSLGENVVAEVLQKGYKYKDKIIRPSMVKVAN